MKKPKTAAPTPPATTAPAQDTKPQQEGTNMQQEIAVMKGTLSDNDPITVLMTQVSQLRIDVDGLKLRLDAKPAAVAYTQSPKQTLRWACVKAAKDLVKGGATMEAVGAQIGADPTYSTLFTGLSAADKQLSVAGILRIVEVQLGGPKKA
jgi:hypothetical protein